MEHHWLDLTSPRQCEIQSRQTGRPAQYGSVLSSVASSMLLLLLLLRRQRHNYRLYPSESLQGRQRCPPMSIIYDRRRRLCSPVTRAAQTALGGAVVQRGRSSWPSCWWPGWRRCSMSWWLLDGLTTSMNVRHTQTRSLTCLLSRDSSAGVRALLGQRHRQITGPTLATITDTHSPSSTQPHTAHAVFISVTMCTEFGQPSSAGRS